MTSNLTCPAPQEALAPKINDQETWRWIPFLREAPKQTMERDREILKNSANLPILRFYGWAAPALSYGRTRGIDSASQEEAMDKGRAVVQRPTGGGYVEHEKDICFSMT